MARQLMPRAFEYMDKVKQLRQEKRHDEINTIAERMLQIVLFTPCPAIS